MNIICLSTQNWDANIWTNKQHIMYRLSKEHRIIYVDKGVMGLRNFAHKRDDETGYKWTWKHIFNLFEERNEHLTVLAEKFNFPYRFGFKIWLLKRYIKKHSIKDIILWIYQPEYEKYIGQLGEKFVVYDCVDEYSAFPEYARGPKKKERIVATEKRLLHKADLVITTSENLYKNKKKYNKNTYLVHNVGNAEHFMKALNKNTPIPEDIQRIRKPIIGFIGALDKYKVDFELLRSMAETHPEWSIVLIGSVGKIDTATRAASLRNIKNIHMMGSKDYKVLPNYIKAFDVCMIPYNINEYTASCFPIKFFEFMATGKPVVTTALPALKEYASIVKYSGSRQLFIKDIEELLKGEDQSDIQKRIEFANNNSWSKRINGIMTLINQRLKEKYNIV